MIKHHYTDIDKRTSANQQRVLLKRNSQALICLGLLTISRARPRINYSTFKFGSFLTYMKLNLPYFVLIYLLVISIFLIPIFPYNWGSQKQIADVTVNISKEDNISLDWLNQRKQMINEVRSPSYLLEKIFEVSTSHHQIR